MALALRRTLLDRLAQRPGAGVVAVGGGGCAVACHEPPLLQGLQHLALPPQPLDALALPHPIIAACTSLGARRRRAPCGGWRQGGPPPGARAPGEQGRGLRTQGALQSTPGLASSGAQRALLVPWATWGWQELEAPTRGLLGLGRHAGQACGGRGSRLRGTSDGAPAVPGAHLAPPWCATRRFDGAPIAPDGQRPSRAGPRPPGPWPPCEKGHRLLTPRVLKTCGQWEDVVAHRDRLQGCVAREPILSALHAHAIRGAGGPLAFPGAPRRGGVCRPQGGQGAAAVRVMGLARAMGETGPGDRQGAKARPQDGVGRPRAVAEGPTRRAGALLAQRRRPRPRHHDCLDGLQAGLACSQRPAQASQG
jgi:hypothetical protein